MVGRRAFVSGVPWMRRRLRRPPLAPGAHSDPGRFDQPQPKSHPSYKLSHPAEPFFFLCSDDVHSKNCFCSWLELYLALFVCRGVNTALVNIQRLRSTPGLQPTESHFSVSCGVVSISTGSLTLRQDSTSAVSASLKAWQEDRHDETGCPFWTRCKAHPRPSLILYPGCLWHHDRAIVLAITAFLGPP